MTLQKTLGLVVCWLTQFPTIMVFCHTAQEISAQMPTVSILYMGSTYSVMCKNALRVTAFALYE